MKKRILSILTALALVIALLPAMGMSARAAATLTAGSSDEFHRALANAKDGDTIQLTGSFVLKNPASNNDSLVIDKAVTIQGGGMTLWYAGILLGADVTFKDITLGLGSNVRPAIMANGHTLTLENVTREAGHRHIHLFCGGQTGATQGDLSDAMQGSHGQIILRGNTNLGLANIYAGSISTDGTNNAFAKPATVTIDETVKGQPIEHIYACGALQTYTSENDWFDYLNEINPPFASPGNFRVSGNVTINLFSTAAKRASGDTGVLGNLAQVNYKGTDFLNDSLVLSSIGGLTVESGNLAPTAGELVQNNADTADRTAEIIPVSGGSCFAFSDAPLGVAANATLGLQNLGSTITVGDFTGGGELVLGQSQKLTVAGTVSGTTAVGIGGIFNGHSQAIPTENFTYIDAAGSDANSFTLAAPASRPDLKLVKDGNGVWTAAKDAKVVIVNDFQLASAVVEASSGPNVELPSLAFQSVDATGSSSDFLFSFIDLIISVNGTDATLSSDIYSTDTLTLFVTEGNTTEEALTVAGKNNAYPPAGTYIISVTVPAANSGTGRPITRTATLTVKAAEGGATVIPDPTPVNGLVYNGKEQVGVPLNEAYTVTGGKVSAIDAGEYTVDLKPAEGFTWSDGGTTEVRYTWSIGKADNPNLPAGLSAAAPTAYNGRDGKLIGTTAKMEYAADENFTSPTACTANETAGLQAGDYYVRIAESANYKAGPAVPVTVPQGPVTVTSVAIATPATKTAYKVGEPLDVTGLTLTVTMSDNSTHTVPAAAGMISGFNSSSAAQSKTLTVTYGGKTTTYTVSITGDGSSGTGGGSLGGGGGISVGGGDTETTRNPDGSTTATVTDPATGTVTETTTRPDGSTKVVETKTDGTVTTTDTAKNGVKVETVSKPETETSARVTLPAAVQTATVTLPGKVTPGTVAVDAKTGKIVTLSAPSEDGMMVRLDGSAELILRDRSKAFTDTDRHWAASAIDFVTAHALFSGTSDTAFTPDAPMTRAMVAVVLHNFEGNPDPVVHSDFTDVASGMWYTEAIHWTTDKGITDGYGNGSFGADDPVTLEQLVTFLYRYAQAAGYPTKGGADLSAFPDGADVSGYAVEAMSWAVSSGLVVGNDKGVLAPGANATRAQVASILNRFVLSLMR